MLSFLHSRRMAHDLMILAVLAMEIFFAWRASLMYVFILTGRVNAVELEVVRWLVFLAVGVFGFALATHRHAGIEAIRAHQKTNWSSLWGLFIAVGIVVLHDVAATIYTVGTIDSFGAIAAVVGMCGLVFLPFLVGYMSHAIAEGITAEHMVRNQRKIDGWKSQAELRYWKNYYKTATFVPASGIDQLPSVDELIAGAVAEKQTDVPPDDLQDEDDERSDSGSHRAYISAREVATILDVSVEVARDMIEPFSKHRFAIKGAKNIRLRKPVRGKLYERRAPYAAVLEVKSKMDTERSAKVRPIRQAEEAVIEA